MAVFTALLLLGSVLKDILNLMASGNATVVQLVTGVALLIPFVFAFALPIGMLTAALLVFGRLSADQEITAARAGGWSVLALSAPVIGLGLLLCVVCAGFNHSDGAGLSDDERLRLMQRLFEAAVQLDPQLELVVSVA